MSKIVSENKKANFLENGAQSEILSPMFWKKNTFCVISPLITLRLISFVCLWIRFSYQLKYVIKRKLNFGTEIQFNWIFVQNDRK